MTNCGSETPGRSGRSYFWCRMRSSLSDGGSTSLNPEGWKPPSELWRLVEAAPATEEYVSKAVDGSVLPESGGDDWFANG